MSEALPSSRALTRIDTAMARLVGGGLERAWPLLIGATVELRDGADEFEWLARGGDEFRLRIDGTVFTAMDFGDTQWSDEANPHGAVIESRHIRDRWLVIVRTIGFHDTPGMLRAFSFWNLGDTPVTIDGAATETLPLRREGTRLYPGDFRKPQDTALFESDARGVAIVSGDRKLILGAEGGGRYALFDPDPACCSLSHRPEGPIAPREKWTAPCTYLIPYAGATEEGATRALGEFLLRVKQYRWWKSEGRQRGGPD